MLTSIFSRIINPDDKYKNCYSFDRNRANKRVSSQIEREARRAPHTQTIMFNKFAIAELGLFFN